MAASTLFEAAVVDPHIIIPFTVIQSCDARGRRDYARRTEVDFVEAFAGGDDAFEWFGGTANAKHLVAVAEDDDALGWTFGWSGNVQFAVVQQRSDISDNGIEADNNENGFDFTPRANPRLANVTLVGAPDAGTRRRCLA
jgi:hypothetical protein